MKVTFVRIENFRAHSSTTIPLTELGCLIGENNAGKSSVLHAIQFALEDRKLTIEDFRDPNQPIQITLRLEEVKETDLARIGEVHRDRVRQMLDSGTLTITRIQDPAGKAESKYLTRKPSDKKWDAGELASTMRSKKNPQLRHDVISLVPELENLLTDYPSQAEIREAHDSLIQKLPNESFEEVFASYPTGIAQAVRPLLPTVIYIEAVKDVSTEAKATGSASFSKLLELLFQQISPDFENIGNSFLSVFRKLNRTRDESGSEVDDRLSAVKRVEKTIEGFIQASFPGVSLYMEIPAPSLATLLAAASLRIDDGHEGPVTSKGDGLKRTVLFALLRAYVELRDEARSSSGAGTVAPPYILLFEEPELYLHPRAQRQLMAALESFSKDHQVLVTTHSPTFFRPNTQGFSRLRKSREGVVVHAVDLSSMTHRDIYQLVKHENNEAAFFAQTIVLVEGDSDTFTYPHLASLLDSTWDSDDLNISFVKTEGKGNIGRYRTFFESFGTRAHVITDLDCLVNGFEHLTGDAELRRDHSTLMGLVGQAAQQDNALNSSDVRQVVTKRSAKELWSDAQTHLSAWRSSRDEAAADALERTLAELFAASRSTGNLKELENPSTKAISNSLESLITLLAEQNVYVLRRGDLEYYCKTNSGRDKVAVAIDFCHRVTTAEALRELHGANGDNVISELMGIFSRIYDAPVA